MKQKEKGKQIFLGFLSELEAVETISWLGLRDGDEYKSLLDNEKELELLIDEVFENYWGLMTPSDREEYINENMEFVEI